MKNTVLFLSLMLLGLNSFATTIVFNDAVFENYCLTHFDANNDSMVDSSEVQGVTQLNLSSLGITDLKGIEYFGQLTSLDISSNPNIILDLSSNINIESLDVSFNNLTSIDISSNTKLKGLNASYNNLTTLNIDSNINIITVLAFNNNFSNISVNNNSIQKLWISANNQMTSLNIQSSSLRELRVANSGLNTINLDACPLLKEIYFLGSNASVIDFSYLTNLQAVNVSNNNNLDFLNIKNQNNQNIYYLNMQNNPRLSCIQVDNPNAINTYSGNWSKDNWASYSNLCDRFTYVPDDAFEQYIISNTNETGPIDDWVKTVNIETVKQINTFAHGILDYTGIEDFRDLEAFTSYYEPALNIDFSGNEALEYIEVTDYFALSSIAFSNLTNPQLEELYISNTSLVNLTLKDFLKLHRIVVSDNLSLNTITIGDNSQLENVEIQNSPLTSFTYTNCPNTKSLILNNLGLRDLEVNTLSLLENLNVDNNLIESLDLANNHQLANVYVNNNQLLKLDVKNGNNHNLADFSAINNPNLTCINVDSPTLATAAQITPYSNGWFKDTVASYSDTCGIGSSVASSIGQVDIFPNPVSETFSIQNKNDDFVSYKVYDYMSSLVLEGEMIAGETDSNLRLSKSGIYFVEFKNTYGEIIGNKKIIKK